MGLRVEDAVVVHNSNRLAIHLVPCDMLARTAVVGQEVAAFEVELAQGLEDVSAPIAVLDPRVEPRVYESDCFAVTFWTYYSSAQDPVSPADHAQALQHLHAAMRSVDIQAPHFSGRMAAAEHLLTHRDETPALGGTDRLVLLEALREARHAIGSIVVTEQLLHGEPHPGNVLSTPYGLLFIDLETSCRGPVEFDVAHVPDEVSRHYPDIDQVLLHECRRLVLAIVAAWRWNVRDEFPNGHQYGREILRLLRAGPPWPALGALAAG